MTTFLMIVWLKGAVVLTVPNIKNEKSLTYKIVGNLESDPSLGLISIQTPIAMGLLGKNEGDEVTISTPSGDISLEIEKVKHL